MSENCKDNSKYARREYWNDRYEEEDQYDWLGDYSVIKSLISKYISSKEDSILMLGCGNSSLSRDMYLDGFTNIVNIDISEVCIEKMRQLHQDTPMQWKMADVTDLSDFKDGSFDAVVEKATLDALLVNEKSAWTVSDEGSAKIDSCLSEVSRVLKSDAGKFLSFTFSPLHLRAPLFAKESYQWNIEHTTFGTENGFPHSCFVMTKGQTLDPDFVDKFSNLNRNLRVENYSDVSSSSSEEDFVSRIEIDSESDEEVSSKSDLPPDS